jgi:hypothetical protein
MRGLRCQKHVSERVVVVVEVVALAAKTTMMTPTTFFYPVSARVDSNAVSTVQTLNDSLAVQKVFDQTVVQVVEGIGSPR